MIWPSSFPGLFQPSVLLADQSRFMHMGRRFRHGGSNIDFSSLILLLVVCGLVAAAIWGLSRFLAYRTGSRAKEACSVNCAALIG